MTKSLESTLFVFQSLERHFWKYTCVHFCLSAHGMVGWRGLPVNRAHTNQHLCVHLSFCALYAVFVIVTRALWSGRVRTRSLSKTHTCIQDNGGGSALGPLAPRTHTGTPLHTHSNTLGPPPPSHAHTLINTHPPISFKCLKKIIQILWRSYTSTAHH